MKGESDVEKKKKELEEQKIYLRKLEDNEKDLMEKQDKYIQSDDLKFNNIERTIRDI